jgi:hypothetical protein
VNEAAVLLAAVLSPLLGLGLLLWLTHLEETLSRDVDAARRKPAPPPILGITVQREPPAASAVPEQRTAPAATAPSVTGRSEGGSAVTA